MKYNETYKTHKAYDKLHEKDYPRKRVEPPDIEEQLKAIISRLNDIEDRIEKLEEKVDHLWSVEYEDFT